MPIGSILKSFIPQKPPSCSAVIAAAGNSRRCEGEDKLLYEINGRPVLAYTLDVFQNCEAVKEIVVVCRQELLTVISDICKKYAYSKITKVIAGGETRTLSVYNGVFAVSKKADYIAIHDGARPCVTDGIITRALEYAVKYHAAAPGVSVIPTIKRAGPAAARDYGPVITETIDRDGLYEIQTPQIFRKEIIRAGLANAIKKNIPLTDDCMAAELIGVPVHITPGSRSNIKITESEDLKIVKALINAKEM